MPLTVKIVFSDIYDYLNFLVLLIPGNPPQSPLSLVEGKHCLVMAFVRSCLLVHVWRAVDTDTSQWSYHNATMLAPFFQTSPCCLLVWA